MLAAAVGEQDLIALDAAISGLATAAQSLPAT